MIRRILESKKFIFAAAVPVANFVAQVFGVDLMQPGMYLLDVTFSGLALAQWVLDLRWGSSSDGTGIFGKK